MILIFSTALCQAQVVVDSLETLSDGSIIVQVGGVKYRGLTVEQMKEVLKVGAERDETKQRLTSLQDQFDKFRIASEKFDQELKNNYDLQLQREKSNTKFYQDSYTKEKALREEFGQNLRKCSGKFIIRVCWF